MTVRQPRYNKEEFAHRGDEIYESQVCAQVEADNHVKIVATDIETGAFEVADEILTATDHLFERLPDAQRLGGKSRVLIASIESFDRLPIARGEATPTASSGHRRNHVGMLRQAQQ
jgi:hypothetical protein